MRITCALHICARILHAMPCHLHNVETFVAVHVRVCCVVLGYYKWLLSASPAQMADTAPRPSLLTCSWILAGFFFSRGSLNCKTMLQVAPSFVIASISSR